MWPKKFRKAGEKIGRAMGGNYVGVSSAMHEGEEIPDASLSSEDESPFPGIPLSPSTQHHANLAELNYSSSPVQTPSRASPDAKASDLLDFDKPPAISFPTDIDFIDQLNSISTSPPGRDAKPPANDAGKESPAKSDGPLHSVGGALSVSPSTPTAHQVSLMLYPPGAGQQTPGGGAPTAASSHQQTNGGSAEQLPSPRQNSDDGERMPWEKLLVAENEALVDSPVARERFRQLQESVEAYASKTKKLLRAAKKMHQGALALSTELQEFIGHMDHLSERDPACPDSAWTQRGMRSFSHVLQQVREIMQLQANQLRHVFVVPMEQFIKVDLVKLREHFKKYERAKSNYDACAARWSHLRARDTSKIEECQTELVQLEKQFQSAALELAAAVNRFQAERTTVGLDKFCNLMTSYKTMFLSASDIFTDLDPQLKTLARHIDAYRSHFPASFAAASPSTASRRRSTHKPSSSSSSASTSSEELPQTTIEGYLFKKGKNVMQPWQRRYFCVENGYFVAFKSAGSEKKEWKPVPVMNLLLCTVKLVPDPDRRFTFELVSPMASYMLQASSQDEMMQWIGVIQNAIQHALDQQQSNKSSKLTSTAGGLAGGDGQGGSGSSSALAAMSRLQAFNESCRQCVDCGDTNPCWASISLGVTFCIECSGIHRAMGVHISKVRSLTLDAWADPVLGVLMAIGNAHANAIFEATYAAAVARDPALPHKPPPRAERATRERFIRAKYADKLFVAPADAAAGAALNEQLHDALQRTDILRVAQLLAQGADLQSAHTGSGATALHYAVARGNLVFAEYLFQNGAKVNVFDRHTLSPLHQAAGVANLRMLSWLFEHGADLTLKNAAGRTAADIAVALQAADAVTLLRLASLQLDEEKDNLAQGTAKQESSLSLVLGTLLGAVPSAEVEAAALQSPAPPVQLPSAPAAPAQHHVRIGSSRGSSS